MIRPGRTLASLVALAILASAACEKRPRDARPTGPAATLDSRRPAGLLLVGTLGAPDRDLRRLAELLDAVQPGAGASLTPSVLGSALGQLAGVASLDGVAWGRPVHVLLLDPKAYGPRPVALVVPVADLARLKAGVGLVGPLEVRSGDGYAVVGARRVLDDAASWALGALVRQPAPADPTITVHVAPLLAAYRADLLAFKRQMATTLAAQPQTHGVARMLEVEIDLLLKLGEQVDRVVTTLAPSKDAGTLVLAFVAREGTSLAAFARAQRPSAYPLLARLPASGGAMVMAGRLELDPIKAIGHELLDAIFEPFFGRKLDDDFVRAMDAMIDLMTGEVALSASFAGGAMELVEVIGCSDGARARALGVELFRKLASWGPMDMFGVAKATFEFTPAAWTHEGVAVDEQRTTYTVDPSSPPEVRAQLEAMRDLQGPTQVAALRDVMLMTGGKTSREAMRRAIDAAGGRGGAFVAGPALQAALAESRARKESLLVTLDLRAFAGALNPLAPAPAPGPSSSGLAMGLGFDETGLRLRLTLPVAHLNDLIRDVQARPGPGGVH